MIAILTTVSYSLKVFLIYISFLANIVSCIFNSFACLLIGLFVVLVFDFFFLSSLYNLAFALLNANLIFKFKSRARWGRPVISALRRWKQEDHTSKPVWDTQ
jgi:hypothetical protein